MADPTTLYIPLTSPLTTKEGIITGPWRDYFIRLTPQAAMGANGITDLTGDVTATGPGSAVATIAANAVTNTKLADMAQSTIKGRAVGAGTGDPQDLTAAQAAAIIAAGGGGTVTSVGGTAPIASSGGTTPVISLNDTAVTPGTYGDASNVGQFTVDQKGRLTFAANVEIDAGASTLIGIMRFLGDGATTAFNLADTAEYLIDASDAGLIVDPATYSLSAAGDQIQFDVAPILDNVVTVEYVTATI